MTAVVLCLNAGSSSIKFAVFGADASAADRSREVCRGMAAGLGANPEIKARTADGRVLADAPVDLAGRSIP